jgi:hypothetical protein
MLQSSLVWEMRVLVFMTPVADIFARLGIPFWAFFCATVTLICIIVTDGFISVGATYMFIRPLLDVLQKPALTSQSKRLRRMLGLTLVGSTLVVASSTIYFCVLVGLLVQNYTTASSTDRDQLSTDFLWAYVIGRCIDSVMNDIGTNLALTLPASYLEPEF